MWKRMAPHRRTKLSGFSISFFTAALITFGSLFPVWGNDTSKTTDELWASCLKTASRLEGYIPQETEITIEFLARKGTVKQRYELKSILTFDAAGNPRQELIGAEQLPFSGKGGSGPDGRFQQEAQRAYNPFVPEAQASMTITDSGEDFINGRRCNIYALSWKNSAGDRVSGLVWLEAASALPHRLLVEPDRPPENLTELRIDTYFNNDGKNQGLPSMRIMNQTMKMGIIKQQIKSTFYFHDYIRQPQAAAVK